MILECHQLLVVQVSLVKYLMFVLDIEMFLGENNDLEAEYEDLEENNNLDEPEDYDNNQIEKSTKDPNNRDEINNVANRGDN